jgi:hypothetical protein
LAAVTMLYETACDPRRLGIRDGNRYSFSSHVAEGWVEQVPDLSALNVFVEALNPKWASELNDRPATHGPRPGSPFQFAGIVSLREEA